MGMFLPCLLAAILNCSAMQIFREPIRMGNGPLMALYMFILALFLLLWSIRLYPRNFRRIGKMQNIIEFLIAEFVMEDLIIDFWFPLEKCVIDSLPALAQVIEDSLAAGDWTADPLIDFLRDETNGYIVSYALATFFLLVVLHASRICDIRTLTQEGPRCFFKEIFHKLKLASRRVFRKLGFGKKKVKINEHKNTYQNGFDNYCQLAGSSNNDSSQSSGGLSPVKEKGKSMRQSSINKYCPMHNPCRKGSCNGTGSCSDFEDLGGLSDLEC